MSDDLYAWLATGGIGVILALTFVGVWIHYTTGV